MAGGSSSNRNIWQTITGGSVLRPPELIAEEITRNKDKLLKGLHYYAKSKDPKKAAEQLKSKKGLQGSRLEFVEKLSKFLGLDELQSYDLFCSYLLHEYRGPQKDIQTLLGVDRHAQALMLKIRDYYFSERLYLLRTIKHLLSYWQEDTHPYMEQYSDFLESSCENDQFIKELLTQYNAVCEQAAPTWETHGPSMNERQATIWMNQNLKEQCELLEMLLLFYRAFEHPADALLKLATSFKKQGFGKRQLNKHLLEESFEPFISRIGYLQVILVVEGMDLEFLCKCHENKSIEEHHIAASKNFKELDTLFQSLGDMAHHAPLLLSWTLMRFVTQPEDASAVTQRLGNTALQLKVFQFLVKLLKTEPFNGETTVASVVQTVLYGLMCMTLAIYHEDSLGDTEGLYMVVSKLLKQRLIAEDLWEKGLEEGVGILVQSAMSRFPMDFHPLLTLMHALAQAGKTSAIKVHQLLQELPVYTEFLDHNSAQSLEATDEEDTWRLAVEKRPYGKYDGVIIRRGSYGQFSSGSSGRMAPVIQWQCEYDGWQLFHCELLTVLDQISHGTAVSADALSKVLSIVRLSEAIMTSDPSLTPHLKNLVTAQVPFLIQRFCLMQVPPLELLSVCIEALTCAAKDDPQSVWHSLQQTRLLPYMTENFDNLQEAASGAGLNAGYYGSMLAGYECTQGSYPLTMAILKLVASLVQPLHKKGRAEDLMACIVFITREIFPVFHKWRYYDFSRREQVGQKCLEIFHKVLNILEPVKTEDRKKVCLRDVCVYCLLYTESGRALLDIVSTGVDVVESTLAQQGSALEGLGIEVIQLIRLAFSVLNRLLLLRPDGAPPSPVEHSLSAKPANYTHRHVVAVIAQYIYHRHDPRLPTLATLLLKRLAMVFPMSILACLGNDAEAIRDMYLTRLQANTEDIRLKVVILELLGVCVEMQPGLTEMFLNVQPARKEDGQGKDLSMGRTSCLQTVLNLIEEKKQGTYHCPSDLLCAAMEFIHALWYGRRETAMAVLRERETFWRSVCLSLMRDLPQPNEEGVTEVLDRDLKTCANIIRILAQEMYAVPSAKMDNNVKKVLKEIVTEKRIQYWSQYLSKNLQACSELTTTSPDILADSSTLQLLLAWRNLMLVLAAYKPVCLELTSDVKDKLMKDILSGMEAQFSNGMTVLHIKLASVASALYFTLLKTWVIDIKDWSGVVLQLEHILTLTCANSETLIPSIQIGVLGALTVLLQHRRTTITKDFDVQPLRQLVPAVCAVLQQSTYQLPPPPRSISEPEIANTPMDIKLKLQIMTVCLLEELVLAIDNVPSWLQEFQQHSILPCLLVSLQKWMQARCGVKYVQAVLMFLITLAKIPQAAEALSVNGLSKHICLVLSTLYEGETNSGSIPQPSPAKKSKLKLSEAGESWHGNYCLGICLMTIMLQTLRYNFLQDALDFAGVHQDRMSQCLESLRIRPTPSCLAEVDYTVYFLYQLAHYKREWRLHLPDVLVKLMTGVSFLCQTCVSMMIRPRLLQQMLEKVSGKEGEKHMDADRLGMTPVTRRLSQHSSSDEGEPSPDTLQSQQRILEILSRCLASLLQFSPDLCEILLDQSMDVGEYDPILVTSFSTSSLDQETMPSFGTMVSCINMCLRLLGKLEPKAASPMKSPSTDMPIKRSMVLYVMETALYLIMSQTVRYLREANFAERDKQLLKRELSAELGSFLSSMQRHFRRGPTSPAPGSQLASPLKSAQPTFISSQEQAYFKLVNNFVENILK